MANIDWGNLLFGFKGRINRAKWWLSILVILIAYIVVIAIAFIIGSDTLGALLSFLFWIVWMWITLAAGTKRLHDLNRTGAWQVLFIGAPIVLFLIFIAFAGLSAGAAILGGQTPDPADLARIGGVAVILALIWLGIGIWAFVWFGCLRGTVGPNQYGPDPLEGRI